MSTLGTLGLSINFSGRLLGHNDGTSLTLQDEVENYTDTIQAAGGYDTASMSLKMEQIDIEDWMENGLGRHMVLHNEKLDVSWEGFVNEVSGTLGALQFRRGPLTETANRVIAYYSLDTTNEQAVTTAADDLASQQMYGIWSKVVSASEQSAANALRARDTFLYDAAWPPGSDDVAGDAPPSLNIQCVGYHALLNYPYTEAGDDWTVREKIISVLAQEPNGIFSTCYSDIEANTLTVPRVEDENRTGETVIKALCALGSLADDERRVWGIYAGRRMFYATRPDTVEYLLYLQDGVQHITTMDQVHVMPWNVLPGKWRRFADLLPNSPEVTDLRRSMGTKFIETVTFNAPYDLQISGGRVDRLPQLLARYMLEGK